MKKYESRLETRFIEMKEVEGNKVMYTVLELGGMDLFDYFDKAIRDGRFSLEQSSDENLIECMLIDFNTAVLEGQSCIAYMEIFGEMYKAPEIAGKRKVTKEADVWAFGIMVYILHNYTTPRNNRDAIEIMEEYRSNTEYNTKLDRVIKACVQHNPTDRPTMKEIVQFLNDEIEYFGYEMVEMERLENERLEEEKRKKVERRRKPGNRLFCGLC
uniref:Protein kinase domain-containing protein n=1 Tax=Meloidogyne javanica TaxID=6303 RepID=A0A915NCT9_MELJA